MSKDGRGGQPAKIHLKTAGGWVAELKSDEAREAQDVATFVEKALSKFDVTNDVRNEAHLIIADYRHRTEFLKLQPRASKDKNLPGVGKFADDLQKQSDKAANKMLEALRDYRLSVVNAQIQGSNLQTFVAAAHENLSSIADLISKMEKGIDPQVRLSEIRNETGGKLKALARKHNLPLIEFVRAFEIYPGQKQPSEAAFNKWFDRLNG